MKIGPTFLLSGLLSFSQLAFGSEPGAIRCIESFLKRYERVQSYRAVLKKREFDGEGKLRNDDILQLEQRKPTYTKVVYQTEGLTGIKNNGMVAEFDGSPVLKVKLGKSRGLGFLIKGPASLIVGDTMSIDDSNVTNDEYFTLNRAGFTPLAYALATQLPGLKTAQKGGVTIRQSNCNLSYRKHTDLTERRTLQPEDSVFKLEDEFGTLAYFLYHHNRDKISSLDDLFHRKKPIVITVPRWFFDFDLDFDPKSELPTRLVFYLDGKVLADYRYEVQELDER